MDAVYIFLSVWKASCSLEVSFLFQESTNTISSPLLSPQVLNSMAQQSVDYNNPVDVPVPLSIAPPERTDGRDSEKMREFDFLMRDIDALDDGVKAANEEEWFTWSSLGMQLVWTSVAAMSLRHSFRYVNPDMTYARRVFKKSDRLCQMLSLTGIFGIGLGVSTLSELPRDIDYFLKIRAAAAETNAKRLAMEEKKKLLMIDLKMTYRPLGSKK